jgi:hypothetical protein
MGKGARGKEAEWEEAIEEKNKNKGTGGVREKAQNTFSPLSAWP